MTPTHLTQLGKYVLLERIGQGAMGEVYRARDDVLGRTVALKTIANASSFPDDELLRSFRHEAQAAARLNHPNIVTIFDFGEVDGRLYLVMELLEGSDLLTVIGEGRLETLGQKVELMRRIADGMSYAHAHGFVHSDLKPANIRVLPDGTPKILDFGLARTRGAEAEYGGLVVGTPQYMAPEQIQHQRVDSRSDVFSLGVLYYELLTGRRPFPSNDPHSVLLQVLEHQPEPVSSLDPSLSPVLDGILSRALAKNASDRYQDAVELRNALDDAELTALDSQAIPVTMRVQAATFEAKRLAAASSSTGALNEPIRVVLRQEDGGDRELWVKDRRKPLLDVSLDHGIPHYHECGGRALCSSCRIRVLSGVENLLPRTSAEERLARRLGWTDELRLACQTRVRGEVEVKRLIHDRQDLGLMLPEELAPQERALAVLSCELVDFEAQVENLPPYDLFNLLNRFFLQIGDAAIASGGRIVSYSTAGFCALFGLDDVSARDKCLAAARAAIRASARMEDFCAHSAKYFATLFQLGVTLDFKRMIVGHMGHPSKTEIGTQGSTPYLASRLASVHRHHEAAILATERFVNVVEEELRFGRVLSAEKVGPDTLTLYEVVDLSRPDATFLVQKTFDQCEGHGELMPEIFYELLFSLSPEVEELFAETEVQDRHRMLMETLGGVIRDLADLESQIPQLRELGQRLASHGAEIHHFDLVEQVLIEAVQRTIGDGFSDEVRQAWTAIYNLVVQHMTAQPPEREAVPPHSGGSPPPSRQSVS